MGRWYAPRRSTWLLRAFRLRGHAVRSESPAPGPAGAQAVWAEARRLASARSHVLALARADTAWGSTWRGAARHPSVVSKIVTVSSDKL